MALVIRRMTLDDVAEVYEIDRLSFNLPWTERSFRFEVGENGAARCWVAELTTEEGAKHLAGMVVLWMILDEAHIGTIAVHPQFRQMGIGAKILAQALLDAGQLGANVSLLEVRRGNHAAQKLYEAFGFQVDGVRPRYYRDNQEDAILMSLVNLQEPQRRTYFQSILQGQSLVNGR